MRVFVAGASGAIGKRLVPKLIADGHQVTAMTRSSSKADQLRMLGAESVVADAFDATAVRLAVASARPDIVLHQLTAITGATDFKNFDREFALTNRLRTEGTDTLHSAARNAGARQFIAQSYGSWTYARTGDRPKSEEDLLDPNPPRSQRKSLEAIRYLERIVVNDTSMPGVALRYGNFYGPGTSVALDGFVVDLVRKRRFPLVGTGAGVWSFIHIDDAASATLAAVQRGGRGIYNVVDDDPAPVAAWLPELARAVGARPPRHVPVWLARLLIGDVGVSMMTQVRGASNARAKRELGWSPRYASWREGFRSGLR